MADVIDLADARAAKELRDRDVQAVYAKLSSPAALLTLAVLALWFSLRRG